MSNRPFARKKMMEEHPHCYWCGVEVVDRHGEGQVYRKGDVIHDDTATVDHVWGRLDPRRKRGIWTPQVLSCFRCNQSRSHYDQTVNFRDEHKRRTTARGSE